MLKCCELIVKMDKVKEQIAISELLAAQVFDTLSEEQQRTLDNWKQQSNNKDVAEQILNAEAFSEWNNSINSVDTNEEWNSFIERMETKNSNHRGVIRLNVIKWVSLTAAVFLIGLAIFSLYEKPETKSKAATTEITSIAPGSSHAQLVLSNGEVVDLGKTSQKSINEGNVAVQNEKGILQYSNSKEDKSIESKTNTLRIPRGAEYQLVLSDGTKVWLNSDTELKYAVQFTGKERRVYLKGEAYFEVAHNKEVPFIVSTENQDVQVLGTEFNISAYPEDNNVVTTLEKGKVKVSRKLNNTDVFLTPSEQSVFNKNSNSIQKRTVDTYPYTAWKEGRLVFNNVSLEEFLLKMAKWYDVEIFFKDENIKKLRFTGDLPRYSDMSSILKIIEAEMSVKIKIENSKKIFIYNK